MQQNAYRFSELVGTNCMVTEYKYLRGDPGSKLLKNQDKTKVTAFY